MFFGAVIQAVKGQRLGKMGLRKRLFGIRNCKNTFFEAYRRHSSRKRRQEKSFYRQAAGQTLGRADGRDRHGVFLAGGNEACQGRPRGQAALFGYRVESAEQELLLYVETVQFAPHAAEQDSERVSRQGGARALSQHRRFRHVENGGFRCEVSQGVREGA